MSNLRLPFARVATSVLRTLSATFDNLRGGDIRRLGYETFIVNGDGYMALRHHGTDIVTVRRVDDDTEEVTLDASGWRSLTTADRMRRLFSAAGVPVQVYMRDEDFTVSTPTGHHPYRDGMSFHIAIARDGYVFVGQPSYQQRGA